MAQVRLELASVRHQREEAKLEVQVFAHNHQSMTQQLHTAVQMLLNLVPLARKVYGARADEFLSGALSQAAGCETELSAHCELLAPDAHTAPSHFAQTAAAKQSAVQLVKRRLLKSRFAYGCVSTWASSNSSSCASNLEGAAAAGDDASVASERCAREDGDTSRVDSECRRDEAGDGVTATAASTAVAVGTGSEDALDAELALDKLETAPATAQHPMPTDLPAQQLDVSFALVA